MNRIDRKFRATRGFTLMEVVVALALLAGGILGVMEIFSLCTRAAARAAAADTALQLAQRELELAVHRPAGQLASVSSEDERFRWSVSITDKPHGLMLASAQVEYHEQGEPRQLTISKVFRPLEPAAQEP